MQMAIRGMLLLAAGAASCACAYGGPDARPSMTPLIATDTDVVITGAQADTIVTIEVGQVLSFRRPGDAASRWIVDVEPTVLEPLFSRDPADPSPEVFRFQARQSGETDLSFTQVVTSQPGQAAAAQAIRVTVRIPVQDRSPTF